jgi:ABC-type sulfate transport system substrate-binding protein
MNKIKLLLASVALAASGLACAQQQTLLNVSYDVAREFYKDINAAFVPLYKKTPARTSRSSSPTRAPARRRVPWPTAWTPTW